MDIVHDKKVYIPPSAREKFITNLEDVVRIRGAYKALGRRVVFARVCGIFCIEDTCVISMPQVDMEMCLLWALILMP